ncbi:MAG: T9SS type A sorting domain-containing protein [Bizionia sp.]|nr:T9SS type A sorting domain-containing protein [Bizionia sp.]
MKKITLLFFALALSIGAYAQCDFDGNQYPSNAISAINDGGTYTINGCNYFGEYSVLSDLNVGQTYSFTADSGYISIIDDTDGVTAIIDGASPLTWTATVGSIELHWAANASCGTDSNCHTTTYQNATPPGDLCVDPTSLVVSMITDVSADISWNPGGTSEVDYNVEVYLTGESAAGANTPIFANANVAATTVMATGLSESVTYDVYITAACGGATTNSNLVGPVTFTTTASCAEVSNIAVSNIFNNGLDISWTLGTGNDSALVEVYNVGESAAGGDIAVYSNATATGGMDTASGLLSNTAYDVYVSGQCGTTATAAQGPVSFTTACDALAAPYTEDFETFTVSTSAFALENCWSGSGGAFFWELAAETDTSSGLTGPAPSVTTGNYLFTEATSGSVGDITEITSPLVDLTALTVPALSFSYHMYGTDMGTLEVLVNGNIEYTLTGEQQAAETDPFVTAFVDLSTYAGQTVQVVFRGIRGSEYTSDMAIDNVSFAEAPSCFLPASVSNSALTDVSSTFTWVAGGSETTWEFANLPSPSTEPTSGTSTTSTTATFSTLTPSTTYDFYVRSDCGGGTFSAWVLISYTTPATPPANDECVDAIDLTVNADLACTVVTSGTTVAATASPQPDDATGTPDNDVWFTFTATNNSHQISLTNVIAVVGTSTDMGMSVFDDAAGCNMTATNEVGESDPNTLMLTGLTVGNSYYVRVYGWSSVNSAQTTFDICVGTPLPPPANDECSGALPITASTDSTCDNAVSGTTQSATASASGCTGGKDVWYSFTAPTDGDYIINVVETFESGFASTYTSAYEGACGALTQIGNSTSCSNTGALTISTVSGNVYYISVRSSSATNYVDFDLCIYPAPPVPANDACVDAFVITDFNNGDSQDATSATNNDGFIAVTGCGSANDGVWYTFQVTDAGTINIDVTNVVGWDAEITVLSGDCSAFTCVDNADSGGNGGSEGVSFTATANTQYWVNVGYYSGFTDSSEGPFTIDISTTDTATLGVPLSIEEFDNSSLFSYYPNPVKNTLSLKGVKHIQDVTVLNMLGQDVLRVAPNAITSEIDMSNLQSGTYFVKVTIENAIKTIKVIKE